MPTASKVPRMTPDLFYGFKGPAFDRQFTKPAKPQRGMWFRSDYRVVEDGLEIVNGPNLFNRPLFTPGCHAFATAGDRPALILWTNNEYKKHETGKDYFGLPDGLGYFYLGASDGSSSRWLHEFESCRTLYHPGWVEYTLTDPLFEGKTIHLEFVPGESGAVFVAARIAAADGHPGDLRIVWTHGCLTLEGWSCWASSYDAQSAVFPWDDPGIAANDSVEFRDGLAVLQDGRDLRNWVAVGSLPAPSRTFVADAQRRLDSTPDGVFAHPAAGKPIAAGRLTPIATGETRSCAMVLNWGRDTDAEAATRPLVADSFALVDRGKEYFRKRTASILVNTPDAELDTVFAFNAVAVDSLWHDPGINHGPYSWGGLTTIFRVFYGPTCCGDHRRIASALGFHCRVDENGRLRNLASTVDDEPFVSGYESFGSTVDMLWHHYLWTADRDLLRRWAPIVDQLLAYEERIQKDKRGLFRDSLGFWCSDSFNYEEGCAVGTTFVWRMYTIRALIAAALGEDPGRFSRRAEEIREVLFRELHNETEGYFHDSVSENGDRVPSAIAPAIYHPIEYGLVEGEVADRMFDWMLRRLTSPQGIVRVDDWFPINWSHNVHSPLETGNSVIAGFKLRRTEAAYRMLSAVAKSTMHGAVAPGSISCLSSSTGFTKNGTDFGDGVSLFMRGVVEGLFGIGMNLPEETISVAPNFPREWSHARISIPDVKLLEYRRREGNVELRVLLPRALRVVASIPVPGAVKAVRVNGSPASFEVVESRGVPFVRVDAERSAETIVSIDFEPAAMPPSPDLTAMGKLETSTVCSEEYLQAGATEGLSFQPIEAAGPANLPFAQIHHLYPGELVWHIPDADKVYKCVPDDRFAGQVTVRLVSDSGVPFTINTERVLAVKVRHESRTWKKKSVTFDPELPEAVSIPVNRPAKEVFLLISGICSPMTCYLPQIAVDLVSGDGTVRAYELRSPYEMDFISQHTSVHTPVSVGWFGEEKEMLALPGQDASTPNPAGDLSKVAQQLHADVIRLKGPGGMLKEIRVRCLRRHAGAIVWGVTLAIAAP